jgi:hypothetical protein
MNVLSRWLSGGDQVDFLCLAAISKGLKEAQIVTVQV